MVLLEILGGFCLRHCALGVFWPVFLIFLIYTIDILGSGKKGSIYSRGKVLLSLTFQVLTSLVKLANELGGSRVDDWSADSEASSSGRIGQLARDQDDSQRGPGLVVTRKLRSCDTVPLGGHFVGSVKDFFFLK